MSNTLHTIEAKGWYNEGGKDYDVVLSTRVRLSRNLAGHKFPGMMATEEEQGVQEKIVSAFSYLPQHIRIRKHSISDLGPTERRILLERNLLTQNYTLQTQKAFLMEDQQRLIGLINEIDHLRLACFHGGLTLEETYRQVDRIDSLLEKYLEYAVSLDLGYINTELTNIGTGMRTSVMLHLPALVETALIDKTFKTIVQLGLNVKGFFGDDENSLGHMYQISNSVSIGMSEKEIQEKLENITQQIVNYERRAREEMLKKRKIVLEDRVFRAFGILNNCKTITSKESIELLLDLRLGASLNIIDVPITIITALLFLTQKAHIQQLVRLEDSDEEETGTDRTYLDYMRAKFIQTSLRNNSGRNNSGFLEGKHV